MGKPGEPLYGVHNVDGAYWDSYEGRWKNTRGEPQEPPSKTRQLDAASEHAAIRLIAAVPELEKLIGGMHGVALKTFVEAALGRADTQQLAQRVHQLIDVVLQHAEARAQAKDNFANSIDQLVTRHVETVVSQLVHQEVTEALRKQPGLIEKAIRDSLNSEKLQGEAQNLITPKMVELIKELRLEMTAGAGSRRY